MANSELTTSYLSRLSNANHDGVTAQIYERLVAFTTSNQLLTEAVAGVGTARTAEDVAYKRVSAKDFVSDDLKKEDQIEDRYMVTVRGMLNALTELPDDEPMKRKAEEALQVFKDFHFLTTNGYEAEARKTLNMVQEWQTPNKYDIAALGIGPWIEKANVQAGKVLQLVAQRVDNESAKVKGELADARKVTDAAIRRAFDVLNAMTVLTPSAELSALVNVLFGIEDRAKLYYINGASPSGEHPGGADGANGNNGSNGSNGTDEPGNSGNSGGNTGGNTGGGDNGGGSGSGGGDNGGDNPGGGGGSDYGNGSDE